MAKGKPSLKTLRRGRVVYRVLHNSIEEVLILSRPEPHSAYLRRHDKDRYAAWRNEIKHSTDQQEVSGLRSIMECHSIYCKTLRYWNGGKWEDAHNWSIPQSKPNYYFVGDLIGHGRQSERGAVHSFFSDKAAINHIRNHYIDRSTEWTAR